MDRMRAELEDYLSKHPDTCPLYTGGGAPVMGQVGGVNNPGAAVDSRKGVPCFLKASLF